MTQPKLTAQDRKWMAEDDARTLAQAEAIKADAKRVAAAKNAAAQMVKEQEQRTKALKTVANKPVKQTSKKK
jgi:hypothetical protein